MARKFKDYYDLQFALDLAAKIHTADYLFDQRIFMAVITQNDLTDRTLMARLDLFVQALEKALPENIKTNLDLFSRLLGPELSGSTGMYKSGWWLWPFARYTEMNGLDSYVDSMGFINQLTRRFTGEFAIRPFLEAQPARTLQIMEQWSHDENVHVRRLASEGMRIRLPWAKKSLTAIGHPQIFQLILSNLRHDPEKFVQKSVGNNLNDLLKEKPDLALHIVRAWENGEQSSALKWIINHGMRNYEKTKNPGN